MSVAAAALLSSPPPSASAPVPEVTAYEVRASECPGDREYTGTGIVVRNWHECEGEDTCTDRVLLTALHVIHRCETVLVQPLLCGQADVDQSSTVGVWTSPDNHPVATWPEYDLAALPLPDTALVEAAVGELDFHHTPKTPVEYQLRARQDHRGCPNTGIEVVDTQNLLIFVSNMHYAGTIESVDGLIGKPSSTHRKQVSKVNVLLHRKGGSGPGASGGALWDLQRERIVGIHQAGFDPGTSNSVDGWAIQIPSKRELQSCLDRGSQQECALLGPGQAATWPDTLYESDTLEALADRDWRPPPPLENNGLLLGVESGWQPMYDAPLDRLSYENFIVRCRMFFEIAAFGPRNFHSWGVDLGLAFRGADHSIIYVAPTGAEVDASSHRLYNLFLELYLAQFRLFRHGRAGLDLGLGGRLGFDFPDLAGKREGLQPGAFRPGLLFRPRLRVYLSPRVSMLFAAEYAAEFAGNTRVFAFEGVFPNTKVAPMASSAFSGHVFGTTLGFEFRLMYEEVRRRGRP